MKEFTVLLLTTSFRVVRSSYTMKKDSSGKRDSSGKMDNSGKRDSSSSSSRSRTDLAAHFWQLIASQLLFHSFTTFRVGRGPVVGRGTVVG